MTGISAKLKDQSKQDSAKIKDSFIGKLLAHTVVFGDSCHEVVFQTNVNLDDTVIDLFDKISVDDFSSKYVLVLIDRFNECFSEELKSKNISVDDIKICLRKIAFGTDVQHLKDRNNNFDETVHKRIYEFSEVYFQPSELDQLLLKLLDLVEKNHLGSLQKYRRNHLIDLPQFLFQIYWRSCLSQDRRMTY